MGILIENFSPAAAMVFVRSALQSSYLSLVFLPIFVKYTMVVNHIHILIEK